MKQDIKQQPLSQTKKKTILPISSIQDISRQLDYSITSTEERKALLHLLLEVKGGGREGEEPRRWLNPFLESFFSRRYNPNLRSDLPLSDRVPVCYNLSYIAGYLLFNREETEKEKMNPSSITREKTERGRQKKRVSLEGLIEEQGEDSVKPLETSYKLCKPSVSEEDKKKWPELRDYDIYIEAVKKQIEETTNSKELYRLKQILKESRQDQFSLKLSLSPPISFSQTFSQKKESSVWEETGSPILELAPASVGRARSSQPFLSSPYLLTPLASSTPDNSLEEKRGIDFSKPKHILELLKAYVPLKEETEENLQSDIRHTLQVLEETIEKADLDFYLKQVLIKRIDGKTYEEISQEMKKEYGLILSFSYIAYLFLTKIPTVISKSYTQDWEDWFYTFKERGVYKTCSKCGQVWLRSPKYYRKEKKNKDGLSNICKECRSQDDAKRRRKR